MKKYLMIITLAPIFLAAAIGWSIYQQKNFSAASIASEVNKNLAREAAGLQKELQLLSIDTTLVRWSALSNSFFLLDDGKITKWNSSDFPVTVQELSGDFEWKLIRASRSELLAYKKKLNENRSIVGIILLHRGYELTNRYLAEQWNEKIFPFRDIKILDGSQSDGALICLTNDICPFRISISNEAFIPDYVSVFLVALSLIMFFVFVFILVRKLDTQRKHFLAFVFLFSMLSLARIAMVRFSFPSRWLYLKIFDPKYFASSSFNASVGDFFLNALIVLVACAYLFRVYAKTNVVRYAHSIIPIYRFILAAFLLTAAYFSFLFPHLFVESIFHDSVIPFDITADVRFDSLRVLVLLALCLGCLSSFFFVHIFIRLSKSIVKAQQFIISLLTAIIIFVGYFLLEGLNYWPTLIIGTTYFLILFYSSYYRSLAIIGYRTFPFFIIAISFYAAQCSWGVFRFAEEKKLKSMFRSAANLVSNDVLGEYLLQQASQRISDDSFIAASVDNALLSKNEARQKIKQMYLSDYFNRYAVTVNLYHADGSPADSESPADFATTIKTVQEEADKTSYEGIYLIQNRNAEILKRYLTITPLKNNGSVSGYVIIDLSVRHIAQQQVYPSLLIDNRFSQSLRNREFSYATYNKSKLIDHFGSYNFERDFDIHLFENPKLYFEGVKDRQSWLVGLENETGNSIVLAAGTYPKFNVLANFAFLFSIGVLIILLVMILFFAQHLIRKRSLNYSARIQVFAYMAFIIPLIVVSTIALRMINQSNELQFEKEIQEKGQSVVENLSNALGGKLVYSGDIKNKLLELSQTIGTEMNLYDANGELAASSQPSIFKSHLTMPFVNRSAWEKIAIDRYYVVNSPCKIGLLDYNSYFFALKSKSTDELLGILELPFFEPTSDIAQASVLSNILVTFAGVFILFSFLSLSALGKLTSPLRFIAKKLNTTSLTNNQHIDWNTNDEIGQLVKEYNRMLQNLEQSKIKLARNEKESAWREIAQQVAHEIKNPLTPMKLTLQQLELLIANGDLTQEKTRKSVQTLLSQVETLNEIATAFSGFATFPAPVISKVDISELLKTTSSLFENNSLGEVYFQPPASSFVVQGDSKLLGRIFFNIILNGLQSGSNEGRTKIEIRIIQNPDNCVISFLDNGTGIAQTLRDKIFLPHFSTKHSGSGLGLAIAKQGIEQMGGTIWFETSENGTCFYVKLKTSET